MVVIKVGYHQGKILFFFICYQECQWFNGLLYHIRHSLQILEQCVLGGSPAIPTSLAPVVDALQEDVVPGDWLHPDCQPSPHSVASWLKGNDDLTYWVAFYRQDMLFFFKALS